MTESSKNFVDYCSKILGANPNFSTSLGVASGAELAEKLALGSAKQAIQIAEKTGASSDADCLKTAVIQGRLDDVVSYAEGVYKRANPQAEQSLVGLIFDSLTQEQQSV